jgi:hypothetical protein
VTLPKWGMMRDGVLWERTMPVLLTSVTESGSWATPNANMQAEITEERALELGWIWKGTAWYTADGVKKNSSLTHQVKMFPTPYGLSANQGQGDGEFGKAIRNWPTPRAADYKGAVNPSATTAARVKSGMANLPEAVQESVKMWPPPCASEARQGYQNRNNGKKGSQKSLTTVVVDQERWMWPPPSAQQQQGGVQGLVGGSGHREKMKKAGHHEMLTGQLNPNWVEWLMGWPVGWTDCGALEMDRFRKWPHSPGTF